MSEYQYYEFQAIDRPLTRKEMDELGRLSTRAEINPTSFTNTYHWGDFKGEPEKLMWRYFDAFVYVANWGTHRLMFRLPRGLIDHDAISAYGAGSVLTVKAKEDHVLVEFLAQDDSGERWEDEAGEEWMPRLVSLRNDLLAGDHRAMYLGWLAAAREGELDDKATEPPVPPGLGKLTGPLKSMADFMRVDDDLLDVAARRSGPAGAVPGGPGRDDLAKWIGGLPGADKDALLLQLAEGDAPGARLELLRRLHAQAPPPKPAAPDSEAPRRTVAELIGAADARAEERTRQEAERRAAERERKEREQAAAREKYLKDLSGRQDQTWREIDAAIQTKVKSEYDRAVELLKDLRDVSDRTDARQAFEARVRQIREQHTKKTTLVQRLDKAGLVTPAPRRAT